MAQTPDAPATHLVPAFKLSPAEFAYVAYAVGSLPRPMCTLPVVVALVERMTRFQQDHPEGAIEIPQGWPPRR